MAARRKTTYYHRSLVVFGFLIIATPLLIYFTANASATRVQPGKAVLGVMGLLAFLYCILQAVHKTADCLSEEKREGTLGLLFLTDLRGYDIVLGKLAATSLDSFYGLLALLPLLGLTTLLGGVTGADVWHMLLALIDILFFSLAAGMLISCGCTNKASAQRLTIIALLAVSLVPLLIPLPFAKVFSPILLLEASLGGVTRFARPDYLAAICAVNAAGWLALAGASVWVRHCWQEGRADAAGWRLQRWPPGKSVLSLTAQEKQLTANPVSWLMNRYSTRKIWLWLPLAAAILAATSAIPFPRSFVPPVVVACWTLNLLVLTRLATVAPRCLNEARKLGALETFLTCPLTNDEIVQGHEMALRRHFVPVLYATFALEFAATANIGNWGHFTAAFVFCLSGYYVLQPFAVISAGMWFGLTSRNENVAAVKTIFFVLILPALFSLLGWPGLPLLIGSPIYWTVYARKKLRAGIRIRAALPFEPTEPLFRAWLGEWKLIAIGFFRAAVRSCSGKVTKPH